MVTIAGRLEDPLGNAIAECQIELITKKNGSAVLVRTSATSSPDGAGNYTMNVKPGMYAVRLIADGCPPNYIGDIKIYSDSKSGTLNDFLLNPEESEITSALLAQVTEERKQAQTAAQSAQKSATQASSTLTNVVKKTGDTMSGDLNITKTDPRLNLIDGRKQNKTSLITNDTAFAMQAQNPNDSNLVTRLRYTRANKIWSFDNCSDVTINDKSILKKGEAVNIGGFLDTKDLDTLTGSLAGRYFQNYTKNATAENNYPTPLAGALDVIQNRAGNIESCIQIYYTWNTDKIFYRRYVASSSTNKSWSRWIETITTANSTVDSNGFYKKASPICRLFGDNNTPEVDGFTKSGCGLVNNEACGIEAKRIDVGHYEIHGSLGFAKEGWYITLPEDANGNKKIFAEYTTDENNVITVKTFTRKFDIERCEIVAGEPIDITAERWIDVRLEMPVQEMTESHL